MLVALSVVTSRSQAQNVANYESVPDPTLYLLREPAIHRELQLTEQQRQKLVDLNSSFDGILLSSRNKPAEENQAKITKIFERTREHVKGSFSNAQQVRLRQVMYRLRGISFVLLPSPSAYLELTDSQKEKIEAATRNALATIASVQTDTFQGQQAYEKQRRTVMAARKEELDTIIALLSSSQQMKLRELVGPMFDTSSLGRVTFKAPDLTGGTEWINSEPLSLEDMKGKVVALHFWAFG